jgi:hypothetical protein
MHCRFEVFAPLSRCKYLKSAITPLSNFWDRDTLGAPAGVSTTCREGLWLGGIPNVKFGVIHVSLFFSPGIIYLKAT